MGVELYIPSHDISFFRRDSFLSMLSSGRSRPAQSILAAGTGAQYRLDARHLCAIGQHRLDSEASHTVNRNRPSIVNHERGICKLHWEYTQPSAIAGESFVLAVWA